MRLLMATVCSLAFPIALTAQQFRWTETTAAVKPAARSDHGMAYDAARGVTLLFGGNGSTGQLYFDTWAYDAAGWRELRPRTVPPARASHEMAYDPLRQRVVMMGGTDGSNLQDIWEWDGVDWTLVRASAAGLAPRGSATFDPSLGGVLFNSGTVNRLWDGATWSTVQVVSRSGGNDTPMVYDAATGGVICKWNQQTLLFQRPSGWTSIFRSGVFDRTDYALAVDPFNARPVLHGGRGTRGSSSGPRYDDTWEWRGNGWTEILASGPQHSRNAAMTFDLIRRVFVLFGGDVGSSSSLDRTWELAELAFPASYTTFGQGCSGTSGYQPSLQADPSLGQSPILGGNLTVRLDGLAPTAGVFGVLGGSGAFWGPIPLPFEFTPVGMPGCFLYASIQAVVPLGFSSGQGVSLWTLAIPNDGSLLGGQFYQQGLFAAAGANPTGLLWTNGGVGTIGYR